MMPIEIDKETDHFFISINKIGIHSFVMLGVYNGYNVKNLLCRVGKIGKREGICSQFDTMYAPQFIYQYFFSKVNARIRDERMFLEHIGNHSINYQAYDITYRQYIEFIKLLESIQSPGKPISCYKPISEEENNIVLYYTNKAMPINLPAANTEHLKKHCSELNSSNSCRHSALELIEESTKVPVSSVISNRYYSDLLCHTEMKNNALSNAVPFYVFPVPPAAYPDLNKETKKTIETLYKRMEQLLILEPNSLETQKKFTCLKQMYVKIVSAQQELNLDELLQSIQLWKQENQRTLGSLRKTYFWDRFVTRKSATMIEVDLLIDDLVETQNLYK